MRLGGLIYEEQTSHGGLGTGGRLVWSPFLTVDAPFAKPEDSGALQRDTATARCFEPVIHCQQVGGQRTKYSHVFVRLPVSIEGDQTGNHLLLVHIILREMALPLFLRSLSARCVDCA